MPVGWREPRGWAAVEYAALGWRVLPGAVWDGVRYTRGHVPTPTGELEPILPVARASAEPNRVWRWWRRAPYSVLVVVGDPFAAVRVPTALAHQLTGEAGPGSARWWGPIALAPEGAVCLVRPHRWALARLPSLPGVAVLPAGALLPLPPTRIRGGAVTWQVSPTQTGGQPGDPAALLRALRALVTTPAVADAAH